MTAEGHVQDVKDAAPFSHTTRIAINSSRSRNVRQYRKYHLMHSTITCSSKWRCRNSAGRVFRIADYDIRPDIPKLRQSHRIDLE
jgi:hypothetical protein